MGRSAFHKEFMEQLTKEKLRQGKDVWMTSTPSKQSPKAIYMDECDYQDHMLDAWTKVMFANLVKDGKAVVTVDSNEAEPEKVIPLNSDKPRTKAIVW